MVLHGIFSEKGYVFIKFEIPGYEDDELDVSLFTVRLKLMKEILPLLMGHSHTA